MNTVGLQQPGTMVFLLQRNSLCVKTFWIMRTRMPTSATAQQPVSMRVNFIRTAALARRNILRSKRYNIAAKANSRAKYMK